MVNGLLYTTKEGLYPNQEQAQILETAQHS